MVWTRLTRKTARSEPLMVGIELNASRVRAAAGPAGIPAVLAPLENARTDLPLAISLEGRSLSVGQAGLRLCRLRPHLSCTNFLPHVGEAHQWAGGRHRLDAVRALSLAMKRLQICLDQAAGVVLAVPSYLSASQAMAVADLAGRAGLTVLGTVSQPLAVALSAHRQQPWSGLAVVVDVDEHALTWAVVQADIPVGLSQWQRPSPPKGLPPVARLCLVHAQSLPRLGLRIWTNRLIDLVAERCIRQCRRDLRDCGEAEQALFDQLDAILDLYLEKRVAAVAVQATHWHQDLVVRPEELDEACLPLVRSAIDGMWASLAGARAESLPTMVLVTSAAARLPGLLPALRDHSGSQAAGQVLTRECVAQAAHALAGDFLRGDLPRGHLAQEVPLNRGSRRETVIQAERSRTPPGDKPDATEDDFSIAIDE